MGLTAEVKQPTIGVPVPVVNRSAISRVSSGAQLSGMKRGRENNGAINLAQENENTNGNLSQENGMINEQSTVIPTVIPAKSTQPPPAKRAKSRNTMRNESTINPAPSPAPIIALPSNSKIKCDIKPITSKEDVNIDKNLECMGKENVLKYILPILDLKHDFSSVRGSVRGEEPKFPSDSIEFKTTINYILNHNINSKFYNILNDISLSTINNTIESYFGDSNEYAQRNKLVKIYNLLPITQLEVDINELPNKSDKIIYTNQNILVKIDNRLKENIYTDINELFANFIYQFYNYDISMNTVKIIADIPQTQIKEIMMDNYFNTITSVQNMFDSGLTSRTLIKANAHKIFNIGLNPYIYKTYSISGPTVDRDYTVADIITTLHSDKNTIILTIKLNGLIKDGKSVEIKEIIKYGGDKDGLFTGFGSVDIVRQLIYHIYNIKDMTHDIPVRILQDINNNKYTHKVFIKTINDVKNAYKNNGKSIEIIKRDLIDFIIEWKFLGDRGVIDQAREISITEPVIYFSGDSLAILTAQLYGINTIGTIGKQKDFILYNSSKLKSIPPLQPIPEINYTAELMDILIELDKMSKYSDYFKYILDDIGNLINNIKNYINNINRDPIKKGKLKNIILKYKLQDSLEYLENIENLTSNTYTNINISNARALNVSKPSLQIEMNEHTDNNQYIELNEQHFNAIKVWIEEYKDNLPTLRLKMEIKDYSQIIKYIVDNLLPITESINTVITKLDTLGVCSIKTDNNITYNKISMNTNICDTSGNLIINTHINLVPKLFTEIIRTEIAIKANNDRPFMMIVRVNNILNTFKHTQGLWIAYKTLDDPVTYKEYILQQLEALIPPTPLRGGTRRNKRRNISKKRMRGGNREFFEKLGNFIKSINIKGDGFEISSIEKPVKIEHRVYASDADIKETTEYKENIAKYGPHYERFFITLLYSSNISLLSMAFSLSEYNLETNENMRILFDKYMADTPAAAPAAAPVAAPAAAPVAAPAAAPVYKSMFPKTPNNTNARPRAPLGSNNSSYNTRRNKRNYTNMNATRKLGNNMQNNNRQFSGLTTGPPGGNN